MPESDPTLHILWVLGAGTNGRYLHGTESLIRCRLAAQAWKSGRYNYVLVSGGTNQPHQTYSEAILMAQELMRLGVPSQYIILEDKSIDSFTNIWYSVFRLNRWRIIRPEYRRFWFGRRVGTLNRLVARPRFRNQPAVLHPVTHRLHDWRIRLSWRLSAARKMADAASIRLGKNAGSYIPPLRSLLLGILFIAAILVWPSGRSGKPLSYRQGLRRKMKEAQPR